MHVISRKALQAFWTVHPDAEQPLKSWYSEARNAKWASSVEIKNRYRSSSIITNGRYVFNIGGNKYRLIVRINFRAQRVFIRFIGTHREYDKVNAETV